MISEQKLKIIRKTIEFNHCDNWDNLDYTNCYMYALKIDMDGRLLVRKRLLVGDISGTYKDLRDNKELENSFLKDMERLQMNVQIVDPFTSNLLHNEWKVALYNSNSFYINNILYNDFHFIRCDNNSNIWTQKHGRLSISKVLFMDKDNPHPKDAKVDGKYNNQDIHYEYVNTYKLSLK